MPHMYLAGWRRQPDEAPFSLLAKANLKHKPFVMRFHVNQAAFALAMLLTCTLVAASLLLVSVQSAEVGRAELQQSVRTSFNLPKLFDFENFKQLFKKSYISLVESLARKRLYLARALKVFLSAVNYKHRRSSIYLAINHMSDWTPEEEAKTHLSRKVMEELTGHMIASGQLDDPEMAEEEEIGQKFSEILENPNGAPGYKEIAEELRRQQQPSGGSRKRREVNDLRELPSDSLIGNPEVQFERSERIKSNNPDYVQGEHTSMGSDRFGVNTTFQPPLNDLVKSFRSPGFVVSKVQDFSDIANKKYIRTADKSVDEIYFDHRESNCFFAPRRQGTCGSCYVFAAIVLYEWSYCVATNGKKVALSEQYIVDCGDRSGMEGCDGAIMVKVSHFANNYGLELRQHYPYRMIEDTCPYDASTPAKQMGYLRTKDRGYYSVPISDFERMLPLSPMMIGISVSKSFQMYGGGVDMALDCDPKSGHAVVLIGHGREDGEEYWLIRNSYGVDWGVAGHYKLSKSAKKCIDPAAGYMLRSFEIVKEPGTRKVSQEVSDRYTAYLMKDKDEPLETFKAQPDMVVQSNKPNVNRD